MQRPSGGDLSGKMKRGGGLRCAFGFAHQGAQLRKPACQAGAIGLAQVAGCVLLGGGEGAVGVGQMAQQGGVCGGVSWSALLVCLWALCPSRIGRA